jgi:hypothetical protein
MSGFSRKPRNGWVFSRRKWPASLRTSPVFFRPAIEELPLGFRLFRRMAACHKQGCFPEYGQRHITGSPEKWRGAKFYFMIGLPVSLDAADSKEEWEFGI